MHYYQFNIKDYSFSTIRMTLMEDLAFRRMLDLFYESETPLPFELKRIAKLVGMIDFQEEIRSVLNDFWLETESGWINQRAKEEIDAYQAKVDTARANGKKGGRPRTQQEPKKTQSVILANQEKSGLKANHKPLTINHKTNIYDHFESFWSGYPKKVSKPQALKAFKKVSKDLKLNDESTIEFIEMIHTDCKKRFANTEKQFIPNASTYLNNDRWEDEY